MVALAAALHYAHKCTFSHCTPCTHCTHCTHTPAEAAKMVALAAALEVPVSALKGMVYKKRGLVNMEPQEVAAKVARIAEVVEVTLAQVRVRLPPMHLCTARACACTVLHLPLHSRTAWARDYCPFTCVLPVHM